MEEDNISRQADEIEALSAIYGDQWRTEDEAARTYSIQITNNDSATQDRQDLSLALEIQLSNDYPGSSPPTYQLSAPWLRGQERTVISRRMGDIYMENIGESVIYLWVEQLREFLLEKSETGVIKDDAASSANQSSPSQLLQESWSPVAMETDSDLDMSSLETSDVTTDLSMTDGETEHLDVPCPEIYHGDLVHDRKSTFQAHLAPVTVVRQVKLVMDSLLANKKIAAATHNIQAYRIVKSSPGRPDVSLTGCVDDGETHAGSRMLHLLQIVDAQNVLVVVTRWYGGIHLGPDRFKHINNCTRQILLAHGYIKEKDDKKKGPKSAKKGK